jgi:chaperone modulatory protein CbpM
MPATPKQILTGLILDEECSFSLDELSNACSVRTEYIIEMVDEGIIEPLESRRDQQYWSFTGENLLRARKARRLQRDLGINLAGAALVLDLMEEVDQLQQQLRRLRHGE